MTKIPVTRTRRTDEDDLRDNAEQIAKAEARLEKLQADRKAILSRVAEKVAELKRIMEGAQGA